MTIVSDFIQIIGDSAQAIPATQGGAVVPLPSFNTGGRHSPATGLLMLAVRNLNGTAEVVINGNLVGRITASPGTVFSTQLVATTGTQLNNGNNSIALRNVTDPFELKTVMCFFHQDA